MNANAVVQSIDAESSKADDESTVCSVSDSRAGILTEDTKSTNADTQGVVYTLSTKETQVVDDSATSTSSETLTERISRDETEETRLFLIYVAQDKEVEQDARTFAETVAEIVEWWQRYAEEETPTSYQIDFGLGSPINLLMVFALIPENYQDLIFITDEHRSPFSNGEFLSWVHEQTMDVLVGLSIDPSPGSIHFGQGLALMVRDDVDEGWRAFTGRSWLEDQIHLWSNDELEPELYRFPPETEKIVFFFNPTEDHWTVVEVDLGHDAWTYTLYDSFSQGDKGPTWKACREQFPLLEKLICRASGFSEPESREIITAASAQQENLYDCGPIAIYNAIELLEGRKPKAEIDAEVLRCRYLGVILDALYLLNEGLEIPAFRARMREAYLDYVEL